MTREKASFKTFMEYLFFPISKYVVKERTNNAKNVFF